MILKNFLASPFWERGSFFVYNSVRSEVSTQKIIRCLQEAGKRVLVPRVEGNRMSAVKNGGATELRFGILQPASGEDELSEVALTPLLAFDGEGYRLGYGGGYYDRYFEEHPKILRVGLAYAGQATKELPHEKHDLPLDAVITETGVRFFPNGKRLT